ncbi:NitT/TauT family transport system ATP-binding protein OS=Castellaniella defragrans OX=75697 GN=HNR28_000909 PE=4 SV=1 [Castellaniella defragrans]
MPIVELLGVNKSFGSGRQAYVALDNCSLTIVEGEFVCLLGPSGCGKSTLLNIVAGFDKPTSGVVQFKGVPVVGPSPRRVVCFQDSMQAIFPWKTVRNNINYALSVRGVARGARAEIIERCMEITGLSNHADKYPTELSGGMRQRLQISRALAVDPETLLMDEPFGALDAMTRTQMQDELLNVWAATNKSILFITHDIDESLLLADRICVMNKGPGSRIIESIEIPQGRPRELHDLKLSEIGHHIKDLLGQHHKQAGGRT